MIRTFLIFIFCLNSANAAIKIAYVGGLTGIYSQSAQKSLKALKLAVKEFNSRGGLRGQKVEIQEFDTKNQAANIFKIFEEISRNKVVAIVGLHISNETLILAKLAEENHIPMVVASATHPDITKNKKYVVRVCFNDDMQGESLANYSRNNLKAKNVAVVADVSDSFTDYLSKVYQKTFTENGGNITHVYPIRTNDTEFGSIIESLRKDQADLLFLSASAMESGYFLTQMTLSNLRIPVLGNDGWQNNDLILALKNLHQNKINAHFSVHWYKEMPLPQSREFLKNYVQEYHEELNSSDADTVLTYDASTLLLTSISSAKTLNSKDLIATIRKQTIHGVTGLIQMQPTKDPIKPVHILKIKNGKILTN